MLTKKELGHFKQILEQSKASLLREEGGNEKLDLRRSLEDSTGELSSYDNHPADEASELFEREKDLALYEHDRTELADIEKALLAIQNGTYGVCTECQRDIPKERLEAMPTTRYCIEHSPSRQTSDNRPVEEDVLMTAFSGNAGDQGDESVGYDGEDAWQDAARYGTSDTPSDLEDPHADYDDMYINAQENVGYVEDYENFAGADLYGRPAAIYRNAKYENYVDMLEEEDLQSIIGDLPASEKDPYVEEE